MPSTVTKKNMNSHNHISAKNIFINPSGINKSTFYFSLKTNHEDYMTIDSNKHLLSLTFGLPE